MRLMPTAFVFINTEPAAMPDVLKKVKNIEGVEEATMVYGNYDIVAKVKAETMDKLKEILTCQIWPTIKVISTITTLAIRQE